MEQLWSTLPWIRIKWKEIIFEDDKVVSNNTSETPYLHQWFFIRGKIERKLNTNAVQNYEIDKCYFQNIKNGKDVTLDDGRVIDNVELTSKAANALCFCSDTAYNEAIPLINGVDVLYHESTFYNQKKF
jgi:ribonuclease Z